MATASYPVPLVFLTILLPVLLPAVISSSPSPSVTHVNGSYTDLTAVLAFKSLLSDPLRILADSWTSNVSFCRWVAYTRLWPQRNLPCDDHQYSSLRTSWQHPRRLHTISVQ
ncbi:hypothetical protein SEVIR_8G160000v4 [Setaria viridis]|uniref:Leucine-rich repeat-containing N-terminal plant-type domain-containing protein n=1 Tax=Setaria viridis TaxID=4556 RepID=A0A4U6TFW7_SETVI|nr:hypothetical protein SEVIR_8G160000v2 [Setaria viridis]